jgi:arabinogalactan oligomer / maltooligosaccharide transport system substrate-binding protein
MRRASLGLALAAGLAVSMSACSGGSSGGTTASSAAPASQAASPSASSGATSSAPATAAGTLTIWADDTRAPTLQPIAAKFKAEKGVDVKVVQRDFAKMRDDFISQVPTGKGPDIIVGPNDWLGKLVQNGVVAPVELGDKASLFEKVAITAMSYQGKTYGVPYSTENIALLRNTALAPTAPKTFADAIKVGQSLVKAGKAKYPIIIQQGLPNGDPYHLYPLETSFGSSVFALNADGTYDGTKLTIDDAAGLKFADALAKLGKENVLKESITGDIAKAAFLKGQSPFMITGPWNTPDFTKAGLKFSVDPIPTLGGQTAKPFVGVNGFYISAKSANPLVANEFAVDYLGSEELQLALFKSGGRPPALISAYDQVKSDPIIAGFAAVGVDGTPLPNVPAMDSVWGEWGPAEAAIVQGKGGTPATVWKNMAASIRKKIGS